MTTGLPKQPSCLSIGLGISLFFIALLAFFRIPEIVKYTGTALMFVPAKLGIIDVVMPNDVIPLSIDRSPSMLTITKPGDYFFYTSNYDLLMINDAIAGTDAKPWLNMQAVESGNAVKITMIERGLSFLDTPFAKGRPVLMFTITEPGTYRITHPTRPEDYLYLVPDVITGKEPLIVVVMIFEIALIGGIIIFIFRRQTASTRQTIKDLQASNLERVERTRQKRAQNQEEEKTSRWKKPG